MKTRQVLPEAYHLTIVEIEGRYYPLRTDGRTAEGSLQLSSSPQFTWSFEATYGIPPACGPQHTCGIVSFARYAQAVDYCHRYQENFDLLFTYREQLIGLAEYPERNVWYVEEIERLTASRVYLHVTPWWVSASSFLHAQHCSVQTYSLDAAIVQLYALVVERTQQVQMQLV